MATPASQEWIAEEKLPISLGKRGNDGKPSRRLRCFKFYGADTQLRSLRDFVKGGPPLLGDGLISDDGDDASEEIAVKLSPILRWAVEKVGDLPRIWVETSQAHYGLQDPHARYESLFDSLTRAITAVNVLFPILLAKLDASYDVVLRKLREELPDVTEEQLLSEAVYIDERLQGRLDCGTLRPPFLVELVKRAKRWAEESKRKARGEDIDTEEFLPSSQRGTGSQGSGSKPRAPSDLEDSDQDVQMIEAPPASSPKKAAAKREPPKRDRAEKEAKADRREKRERVEREDKADKREKTDKAEKTKAANGNSRAASKKSTASAPAPAPEATPAPATTSAPAPLPAAAAKAKASVPAAAAPAPAKDPDTVSISPNDGNDKADENDIGHDQGAGDEFEPIMEDGEFRNLLEYRIEEEEAPENVLELLGETEPEDDGKYTIPCRTMGDFVVFEALSRRIVPFSEFKAGAFPNADDKMVCASGLVTRIVVPGDDEGDDRDEDDNASDAEPAPVRMTTLPLIRWEFVPADGSIWIMTECAWYRLERPRAIYRSLYEEWAFRHLLAERMYKILLSDMSMEADALLEKLSHRFRAYPPASAAQVLERLFPLVRQLSEPYGMHRPALQVEESPAIGMLMTRALSVPGAGEAPVTKPSEMPVLTPAELLEGYDKAFDEPDVYASANDSLLDTGQWEVADFESLEEDEEDDGDDDGEGRKRRRRGRKGKRGAKGPTTKRVPRPKGDKLERFRGIRGKDKHPATKTPLINDIVKHILAVSQQPEAKEEAGGDKKENVAEAANAAAAAVPTKASRKGEWVGKPSHVTKQRNYYDAVLVDKVPINVGDYVRLAYGENETTRVGRVITLFEDITLMKARKVHCRFLLHGSETLLQETSAPDELFLTNECADVRLSSVIAKVNVTYLKASRDEKPPEYKGPNDYFYRFFYTHEQARFSEAQDKNPEQQTVDDCPSCRLSKEDADFHRAVPLGNAERRVVEEGGRKERKERDTWSMVQKWNQVVHVGDYAYFCPFDFNPADPESRKKLHSELYEIGRIVQIQRSPNKPNDDVMIKYRLLLRLNDSVERDDFEGDWSLAEDIENELGKTYDLSDRRELVLTPIERIVPGKRLEGSCTVCLHSDIPKPDQYRMQEDCFYVKFAYDPKSEEGFRLHRITKADGEAFSTVPLVPTPADGEKLRAMDLFSGCGGFTVGMEKSGAVRTLWAVELDPSASATFRRNSPHTTVLNADCNELLARAMRRAQGSKEPHNGPELPGPREVDFIYCGPPCQGFSGINRFAKADDQLNDLIWTALSYADFYRPRYFLLENVRGMINFKVGGRQEGANRIIGGIKMGVVKSLFRCLTAMGYQVHCALRQAGMHGLPQGRRRFFVWAARRGEALPDFPQPSTLFPLVKSMTVRLPVRPNRPSEGSGVAVTATLRTAVPHAQVTVGDAISDLPSFEYETDPNFVVSDVKKSRMSKHRLQGKFVGEEEQPYHSAPKSDYQRMLRSGGKATVKQHYTKCFNNLNVERICHIPPRPGADHRDLPAALRPWCLSDKASAASRHNDWKGLYGRLDNDGYFLTALTDISPMGKAGTVLHPTQNRVITVRESARAQGFPDDFIFESRPTFDTKPLYRQIGNAVPCPLAHALGKYLAAALYKTAVL